MKLTRQRWAHALELRQQGLTFKEIGQQLNVTPARARELVLAGEKAAKGLKPLKK